MKPCTVDEHPNDREPEAEARAASSDLRVNGNEARADEDGRGLDGKNRSASDRPAHLPAAEEERRPEHRGDRQIGGRRQPGPRARERNRVKIDDERERRRGRLHSIPSQRRGLLRARGTPYEARRSVADRNQAAIMLADQVSQLIPVRRFLFWAACDKDEITGDVKLGAFGNATFSGTRA